MQARLMVLHLLCFGFMEHIVLTQILILLTASVLVVAVFRRIHLPPILGYLFVGMALGPHALNWFGDSAAVHLAAEIGIAFLLFAIGLEFSLPQFWAMRRTLLGLGGMQVLVGTLSGMVIAWLLGIPWQAALIVGGALAMSSTAIVVKQLTDQLELQHQHGRLALGILLFQDLAAVPFLVLIPILANGSEQALSWPLLLTLFKTAAVFGLMLMLGRWLLRPLFHHIAAAHSAELFTLTVLLVSLLAAWITDLVGLSLALGAFLAGMMLSETEYRHQIENDIRPFRDVLLGLFFITVGMRLDLALLPPLWLWITLLVTGLVLGKGLFIAALAFLFGNNKADALRTGLVLGHGGEFGFALLTLALGMGLLDAASSQPILAAMVITMLIAPLLIRHSADLARLAFPQQPPKDQAAEDIAAAARAIEQHVIVCGFGRVGQHLVDFLRQEQLAYIALDLDPSRVKDAWEDGEQVFYGDASQRDILLAAGLERANALVVSFDDPRGALHILHNARLLRDDIPILIRARDDSNLQQFMAAGATEVVPETLEASLLLAAQLLQLLDVPTERISGSLKTIRQQRYPLLHRHFH